MSNIYKFHHVVGSDIKKTYTFNDDTSPHKNISMYEDDMVVNIKHKLGSLFDNQSHDEIYLFCKSKNILNQSVYYQILTQDDNIKLTNDIFERFISNIVTNKNFLRKPNDFNTKRVSSFYANKKLWNKEHDVLTPIGVSAFHRKKYMFNTNPFSCKKEDEHISSDMKKFINTENKKLLFKYKPDNNDIYFCFAEDVLNFFKEVEGVTDEYLLQMYFPNLYSKNIKSTKDIVSSKTKLKSKSTKEYNSTFKNYNKNIDLLYEYSDKELDSLNYNINYIHFTISPYESLDLPLEVMFKKMKSTKLMSLIKFNPGKELENIYRLYTDDYISNKGLKIPSLYVKNKESSRKLKLISADMLYNNRIGIYFNLNNLDKAPIDEEMVCIILANGDIQIKMKCKNNYDIIQLQNHILSIIQKHIINTIHGFTQKKKIYHLKSFNDKNIELNNIDVVFQTDYIDPLTFKNLKCSSSVFTVVNKKKNTYNLNYKRVSFYQKMNDIQSFINIKLQESISLEEIKHMVISNFNITEEKAVEIMDGFLKEIRLAVDAFENRKIKVEDNPGFNILIETKNTDYVNIKMKRLFQIKNINDMAYLSQGIIKRYINALININKLETPLESCIKKLQDKKIEKIQEIYENPLPVESTKVAFGSDNEEDDLFDLMSGLDDDTPSATASAPSSDKDKESSANVEKSKDSVKSKEEDDEDDDSISLGDSISLDDSISLSGGSNSNMDLTSIKIKGSKNWFTNRLRKREPDIFVMSKEDQKNKNFVKYTKTCPWQSKKQPIIVNDDELKKINESDKKSNTKSYDGHIKYRNYNYICPRYWCFKDDKGDSRSISFKQINEGECGGWDAVNPKNAKSLQPGKRIAELTDDRYHNPSKSSNPTVYKPLFPFLQKAEKHSKGLCAPCCSQIPLEHEGFPDESDADREKNKKALAQYYEHLYIPGNDKGNITIEGSQKDNKKLNDFKNKWQGVGPSFNIKEENGKIKIANINNAKNDSKKLTKVDLIPKNKKMSKNPSRDELDELLQKKKNNKLLKKCMNPSAKSPVVTEPAKNIDIIAKTKPQGKSKPMPVVTTQKKKIKPFLFEFPLKAEDSFGYLKPSLQKFIQYDTVSICYNNPPKDYSLKTNASCLLRLGVHKNKNQSFLENIAKITGKSLTQFKNTLVKNITITKFIIAFKGSLINLFYDKTKPVNKKKKEKIVKSINDNIINDFILLENMGEKLINSYINFIKYLKDDSIKIDYSYLWDFICKPNNKNNAGVLFKNGVNMVIFNSPQDDITDKIELVCPKNTFTNEIFSELKPTIMLYKENMFFEPIVMYNNKDDTVKHLFDYSELISETTLHSLFTDIKNKLVEGCALKPSMPGKFDYKRNVSALELIQTIVGITGSRVLKQVIHYNYKTIGIIALINKKEVYIPCYPSHIIIDLDFEYYDSNKILFDAIDTLNTLTILAKKHKINCLPMKILVTDRVNVTGFITETNQMVPTKPVVYDSKLFVIKTRKNKLISRKQSVININENNEYMSDKTIMTSSVEDLQRVNTVRNFILEKNFYSCYRNTFKRHINMEKNGNTRQQLIDLLDTEYKSKRFDDIKEYNSKFKKVNKTLDKIINDKTIGFVIYQTTILNELYKRVNADMDICVSNNNKISLPHKNLMNGSNNKIRYMNKLVDELIRFPRLREYILYNKSISSLDVINYSVDDDEIVILEEELFNDYLVDVILDEKNKYINPNQIGFTKPIKTKDYKTTFKLDYNVIENENDTTKSKKVNIKINKNIINAPQDVNKYSSDVDKTPGTCEFSKIVNKKITMDYFNNYDLNKHLMYHKLQSPFVEGAKGKIKINCTWNILHEMYLDYYKTDITKMDLCKTLLSILIKVHKDKKFITSPGSMDTPNYKQVLELSRRYKGVSAWNSSENKEDAQWDVLFNIIASKDYYLTEFEIYLFCKYFKIPCVIHGTSRNNNKIPYKISKIKNYDPLYTTFNLQDMGSTIKDDVVIKNNLYTNENKDTFCYIVGCIQFNASDYYNKLGVKNNIGINKYFKTIYNVPFDVGMMKTNDDSYRINLNEEYMQQLLSHSMSPTVIEYIKIIFDKKEGKRSIHESFHHEEQLFRKNKNKKTKKLKLIN